MSVCNQPVPLHHTAPLPPQEGRACDPLNHRPQRLGRGTGVTPVIGTHRNRIEVTWTRQLVTCAGCGGVGGHFITHTSVDRNQGSPRLLDESDFDPIQLYPFCPLFFNLYPKWPLLHYELRWRFVHHYINRRIISFKAVKRMFQLADVGTAPRGAPQLDEMGAIIHGEI